MINLKELREIFAQELERESQDALAERVRRGTDNSHGGVAAIRAMERVYELGFDNGFKREQEKLDVG